MKQEPHLENRAHFFAVASRLMRQILVEYARNRNAAKRDGGWKLTLDEAMAAPNRRSLDLVTLDDALTELPADLTPSKLASWNCASSEASRLKKRLM